MSKIKLIKTCGGCPEQYDAYYESQEIGYLRLRHGSFRAEYMGTVVYSANPKGDGIFEYEERDFYLNEACKAILDAHLNREKPKDELCFTVEEEVPND